MAGCLVVTFGTGLAAQPDDPPALFGPLGPGTPDLGMASDSPPTFRHRAAEAVPGILDALQAQAESAGGVVRLNLFEDAVFDAVITGTAPTSAGYSLSGHLVGDELSSVTFVVNGDVVAGTVLTLAGTFTIRPGSEPGVVIIREVNVAAMPPGAPPRIPPGPDGSDRVQPIAPPEPLRADPPLGADDGSRIDVLVVYTRAARRAEGSRRRIAATIDLMVAQTNQAYQRSRAIQRIRLVGTAEVNYTERSDMVTDLDHVTEGRVPRVHALRDRHGADVVMLLVDDSDPHTCGIAWLTNHLTRSFEANAYGVTRHDCGGRTFAHELGHIMGLSHDRYQENEAESDLRHALHPYSFGYINRPGLRRNADNRRRWITIMAYPTQCSDRGVRCSGVMRFSNPNQRLHGDRLGAPGTARVARVNGPADARRTLNETRRTIANFRQARPQSGSPDLVVRTVRVNHDSLRPGQAFTLSARVLNRGDRAARATTLRYQRWHADNRDWVAVGRDAVGGLAAGASVVESIRLNARPTPGTYRYRACVVRVAGEADPDNNCSSAVRVTVGGSGSSCTNDLGTVSGSVVRRGSWNGDCRSVHYSGGEYARYYTFRLSRSASVTMDLTSPTVDTWLALRNGSGTGTGLIEVDDDDGEGSNARISRTLPAGTYTIEATTLRGGETGSFTLSLSVR